MGDVPPELPKYQAKNEISYSNLFQQGRPVRWGIDAVASGGTILGGEILTKKALLCLERQ